MTTASLICLGLLSGVGAGLLAGLVGIGGGIVVVPVVYYGLVNSGVSADQAAHVAVSTSLAAILPAAIVSSVGHWRAGNIDFRFLRDWGPGIAVGVVVAQFGPAYSRQRFNRGFCSLLPSRRCALRRSRAVSAHAVTAAEWSLATDLRCRDRVGFRFRGCRRRHHDEYRHELVGFIDAQKHRSRSGGGGSGRRSRDDCGRVSNKSRRCRATRQHQFANVGVHCAGAGGRGLDRGSPGPAHLRDCTQPRICPFVGRDGHPDAAVELGVALTLIYQTER